MIRLKALKQLNKWTLAGDCFVNCHEHRSVNVALSHNLVSWVTRGDMLELSSDSVISCSATKLSQVLQPKIPYTADILQILTL